MKKQLVISMSMAALSLSMATGVVLAHGGGWKGGFMEYFDANNDGMVTLDEFQQTAEKRFQLMDKDGNGIVTKECPAPRSAEPGEPTVINIPAKQEIVPTWIYAMIGIGAALAAMVIVLIVRTRRP